MNTTNQQAEHITTSPHLGDLGGCPSCASGAGGLLLFGGTTEGRLAVEVCEQAGKMFFYSTKSETQDVEMHNGVRLTGAMSADDIKAFCREHGVKAIIDAAHPFAENLHSTIAQCGLPVIRLQRSLGERIDGVIYCKDYAEAMSRMEADGVQRLLALSGANTIAKLKPFWTKHHTIFRILNRQESKDIAYSQELKDENLIYYDTSYTIPTKDEEKAMMQTLSPDAIITKESGDNGGFDAKVYAALELGKKVYVIEHPTLPKEWIITTGKHTLRRAIEYLVPEFFPLKTGLTTGACATAATKAAAISLLTGDCPEEVSFALPDGEILTIPVDCTKPGEATVTKDWSDDPDVLRGCKITSVVQINNQSPLNQQNTSLPSLERGRGERLISFLQGKGVGKVTLPGLGIPVGEPAINPTPRHMIEAELRQLTDSGARITISVENGEELAKKTFNHKVGVVDGISIIGTSGIVSPLSNEAFVQSIHRELEVAWAIGCHEIGLVAGMKSERALLATHHTPNTHQSTSLPSLERGRGERLRCIHYGNFIGEALKAAYEIGFRDVTIAIMIGKAVKLAEGHLDTHSHKVAMNKDFLKTLTISDYHAAIDRITMARELWDIMPQEFFDRITDNCKRHCRGVFPEGKLTIRLCKV